MPLTICREEHFNAAHRVHNPKWSAAQNEAVFGPCANPNYHGHNYRLVIELTGPINPETGYVYDLRTLSQLIRKEIISRYDHRNLNLDVEDFVDYPPTTEHLARTIYERLRPHLGAQYSFSVLLYETERNYVRYSP